MIIDESKIERGQGPVFALRRLPAHIYNRPRTRNAPDLWALKRLVLNLTSHSAVKIELISK